jgi:hypothetical protein
MKRLAALLCVVAMLSLLFACSGGGGGSDNGNPQLTGTVKVEGGSNQQ